jgi:hypothetical protein
VKKRVKVKQACLFDRALDRLRNRVKQMGEDKAKSESEDNSAEDDENNQDEEDEPERQSAEKIDRESNAERKSLLPTNPIETGQQSGVVASPIVSPKKDSTVTVNEKISDENPFLAALEDRRSSANQIVAEPAPNPSTEVIKKELVEPVKKRSDRIAARRKQAMEKFIQRSLSPISKKQELKNSPKRMNVQPKRNNSKSMRPVSKLPQVNTKAPSLANNKQPPKPNNPVKEKPNLIREKTKSISPIVKRKAEKGQTRRLTGKLCKQIDGLILDGVKAELIEDHSGHACYKSAN